MPKRILVGYGVDVDAVSNWLNTRDGSAVDEVNVSRGVFGATVGTDRLLKLFAKHDITASWFVPAHSLESFPEQMAKVRDGGHELGLHGYTHEYMSQLSRQQERDVLWKSIEVLTAFTGKKPKGFTAPAWTTSKDTISLLEEAGIEYDHSYMHHDSQLYYLPYPSTNIETNYKAAEASEWMKPMSKMRPSSVVEVVANWHVASYHTPYLLFYDTDSLQYDWPALQPKPALGSAGFIDPHHIERFWKEHFSYCYDEYDSFVFPISVHPQVSGKPQILMMHDRLIQWIKGHEGVEFMPFEEMSRRFKAGEFPGVTVEGGV